MTIRAISLIIDVNRGVLVDNTGNLRLDGLRLVRGDDVQLNIDLVTSDLATNENTAYPIDAGTVFRLVGKQEGDYQGDQILVAESTDFNVPGHRADLEVDNGKLSCRFKLNKSALVNALGTSSSSIKAVIDLEAISADGHVSTLIQLTENILNDAARNESQVDQTNQQYMTLEEARALIREVTHPDEGTYYLENGLLYLWDTELEVFSPVALDNRSFAVLEDS